MKYTKIQHKLEKVQGEKRYEHTLAVSYTAASLAMRYGENVDDARLAGLLHDCAKHLSDERMLELAHKYNLDISKVEKDNPFLLHGKIGALIAQKKFEVEDENILNAIRYHTTGRPGMSVLEKIIYISDYIEPNRNFRDNLNRVRTLAFQDINTCLVKILADSLESLKERNMPIDSVTALTYDYYLKELMNNGK